MMYKIYVYKKNLSTNQSSKLSNASYVFNKSYIILHGHYLNRLGLYLYLFARKF